MMTVRKRKERKKERPKEETEGSDDMYNVRYVISRRFCNETMDWEYLLQWQWDGSWDLENEFSWEPAQHLDGQAEWLTKFHAKYLEEFGIKNGEYLRPLEQITQRKTQSERARRIREKSQRKLRVLISDDEEEADNTLREENENSEEEDDREESENSEEDDDKEESEDSAEDEDREENEEDSYEEYGNQDSMNSLLESWKWAVINGINNNVPEVISQMLLATTEKNSHDLLELERLNLLTPPPSPT